ncbi:MAG: hypothetical protein DI564_00130 [Rhodanobacter denitrificans]|uniref:HTH marR-type domain-containing protein n=1 Tax=Rhodanobacter denitrificans TaxID=666685 RepID=A0A2W5KRH3_9GAMM|nr:MAG: hypothetical protein DI564_00130 [Rhodanobacter denitrificans]
MSLRAHARLARGPLLAAALFACSMPLLSAPTCASALEAPEEPLARSGRRAHSVAALRRRTSAPRPLPAPAAPVRARLQAAGLAVTMPRQQVLALLVARGRTPLSGRDIYRRLDYAVSQVTIQRVLWQFEAAGLVERVIHPDDRRSYRLRA